MISGGEPYVAVVPDMSPKVLMQHKLASTVAELHQIQSHANVSTKTINAFSRFLFLQKFVGVTSCPPLLPPKNGIIVGVNSPPTHFGAPAEFQCNLGYNFETEACTVCAVCKCTREWQYTPVKKYCKREIKPTHLIFQICKFVVCSFSV